jgi:hypothetical protein
MYSAFRRTISLSPYLSNEEVINRHFIVVAIDLVTEGSQSMLLGIIYEHTTKKNSLQYLNITSLVFS